MAFVKVSASMTHTPAKRDSNTHAPMSLTSVSHGYYQDLQMSQFFTCSELLLCSLKARLQSSSRMHSRTATVKSHSGYNHVPSLMSATAVTVRLFCGYSEQYPVAQQFTNYSSFRQGSFRNVTNTYLSVCIHNAFEARQRPL